ncbi:hypothetical protein JX266_010948 [Neoarthrinium moseri]|nr:hypothetical protein JX266_010948 [Neoarthrinium moseri]
MAPHTSMSFLAYLRLKILVTCLRLLIKVPIYTRLRRDRLLTQSLGVHTQHLRIPSRDSGRFIDAHLYYPDSTTSPKPVLVNWHGSGFVIPLHGSNNVFCAQIAKETGIFVLDVDYRKSPETPFPGPLEDAEDVLRWTSTQTDRFDSSRVAVSGFSAGATVCLAAAIASRSLLSISAAVLIYPFVDMSVAPEAKMVAKPIKPPPPYIAHIFNDSYVFDNAKRTDPRVSPALAEPEHFPPTVAIATCDGDILEPEGLALAAKLQDAGKKVPLKMLKGLPHSFDTGAEKGTLEWKKREELYIWAVQVLKGALKP